MNKELLDDVIQDGLKTLKGLEPDSDEYKAVASQITQLMDRSIEVDKYQTERQDDKKDKKIKNILTGIGIGAPLVFAAFGSIISLRYEEFGSITSKAGKAWIDRLLKIKN